MRKQFLVNVQSEEDGRAGHTEHISPRPRGCCREHWQCARWGLRLPWGLVSWLTSYCRVLVPLAGCNLGSNPLPRMSPGVLTIIYMACHVH